jgi:CubicO group peptidase (beta-lactamase class C family)
MRKLLFFPSLVIFSILLVAACTHRNNRGIITRAFRVDRMASMTKGLTAVAVFQLLEQGSLQLEDPVSRFIPEFRNPTVLIEILPDSAFTAKPAAGEITIGQLLTHTSGIGYGFQDQRYNALIIKNNISEGFEDDDRTSLENIRRLAKIPLLFEPGEKYTYGLSFDVLGVIVEIVSGMRFDQHIKKHILDPLEMDNSYFNQQKKEINPNSPPGRIRFIPGYKPGNTRQIHEKFQTIVY